MAKAKSPPTHFRCGHERSFENTMLVNKGGGRMVPLCVECYKGRAEKRYAAARKRHFNKRITELDVDELAKDESKKPWNYLRVKPEAESAWEAFDRALDGTQNCNGKLAEFIDYPEDSPPTEEDAILKCGGCPFFDLCEEFAEKETPPVGVWAGRVYGVDK